MKFANMWDKPPSSAFYSEAGTKIEKVYGLVTDKKTGRTEVQITGESNLDLIIQSNSDSGNISLLIARLKAGDNDALNQVKGFYGDVRNMPNTYAEMVSRLNDCHNLFNALPVGLKEQFNNNADEFWTLFGSSEFEHKMAEFTGEKVPLEPVAPVKDSVIDDEKGDSVNE